MNQKYSRYYTYIKPVLRNKAVRTYSSLAFSLITITIFGLYALKPTIQTIFALQKSIDSQQQVLNKLTAKSASLKKAKDNYLKISPETLKKIDGLLPDAPKIPSLIKQIQISSRTTTATMSGLQLQTIDLESSSKILIKKPVLKEVQFTLNSQGSYRSLIEMVNALSSTQRLIHIDSVSFNKPPSQQLLLSITAKGYFLKN